MLALIKSVNKAVNNFIWGVPAMILLMGVGLYLSVRHPFCAAAQVRPGHEGDAWPYFQAR